MDKSSKNLELWMTNLPPILRSIPIVYLAIPGSHDSFAYSFGKNSAISPDAAILLRCLKFMQPILRPFICNWSKTQSVSITQQLNNGIRYFDLRLSTQSCSSHFYCVHNLYAEKVTVIFKELKEFIEQHPYEMVIVDLQHFHKFNTQDHQRFKELLYNTFKEKLVSYCCDMSELNLDYITVKCKKQILVIYRSSYIYLDEPLWPSACFPISWADTVLISDLIARLNKDLGKRNDSLALVSQCVLTPTMWYAIKHLFSSLKSTCALPLENSKNGWLSQQKAGIGGVNIVISDFIEYKNFHFAKLVISLNKNLLHKY